MNRRDFLKTAALGGVAAAVPFGHHLVRAAGEDRPNFLFVVEGNGFEPASLLSDEARAALDAESLDSPVGDARWWYRRYRHDAPIEVATPELGRSDYMVDRFGTPFPLEPLAEAGLVDQATVLLGLSSRIVGGGHSGHHGALSSTRTIGGRPGGVTIDTYLSRLEAVRRATPFDAFRVGVGGDTIDFGTCAYDYGRPAPLIRSVRDAYAFAYGAFTEGDARRAFDQRERMLRFAAEDLAAAERAFTGNPAEQAKLGTYGESIAALLETQERLRTMTVEAPPPPADGLAPLDRFEALLDLAAQALVDELTSVAVVGSGTGGAFSLGYSSISPTARHDMQHQSGGSPEMLDAIRRVNHRQVQAIARAATRLRDAGILDRTVIVWVGDNGEQHHSTSSEFPVLLLGGGAVGLRPGGRTVLYPGVASPENRQLSNLWNTLGYVAGDALDLFGEESGDLRMAPGPLPELLV